MSEVVVNSSIALTWCFDDEATQETDKLFACVRDDGAVVPGLWYLELSNVLLQAEKRGQSAPTTLRHGWTSSRNCRFQSIRRPRFGLGAKF